MKTSQFLAGAAGSCRARLCFFAALCITHAGSAHLINFSPSEINPYPLVKKVQQIYRSQIGVREKGTNSGPAVEQYLRYVNLPKGNPWCAAFVCWVLGEAGISNPRSGWTPDLFGKGVIWTKEEKSLNLKAKSIDRHAYPLRLITNKQPPTTPTTGDVFGLFFPEKGRIAHVGFIDQWDGTWLVTVEGNTNVSGNREGDGVYRKRRLVRSIYKVARFFDTYHSQTKNKIP